MDGGFIADDVLLSLWHFSLRTVTTLLPPSQKSVLALIFFFTLAWANGSKLAHLSYSPPAGLLLTSGWPSLCLLLFSVSTP
jgi:hypothetical protein